MRSTVRHFFLSRPLWQSIPVIVGVSIASSVGALFLLSELMNMPYGPTFARSLTIAIVAPTLVSAPIGGFIVHLLREVEHARNEAVRQAGRDELTGLMNRRHFSAMATRELTLAHRGQRRGVAVLLDVDDFKQVNDTHGHAAGDALLIAVGQTLSAELRTTDLVGRWGGEEFALLLPDVGLDDAIPLAERVRQAVAAIAVPHGGGALLRCTVSIGLTEVTPQDSFDLLINRADQAMYRAKASGKNRIVSLA